ncbi:hypothetical protein GCM10022295_93620 [Streptomyces osmaniensis]|uniref:Uncharacterized protein n=1 Tax=Streptomyces osmaniensis TaxID=593134 RepID=A0ABP6ZB00_9ACTN
MSANWTSATTVPVLESDALYNIGGNESETIEFSAIAGRGVPAGVAAACNWSGTSGTCDWISSADVQGDNVRGVVSFIVVPGTTGEV